MRAAAPTEVFAVAASAGDVTNVMTEPVFEIALHLKALLHQLADERLRLRPGGCADERLIGAPAVRLRRHAGPGVDKLLASSSARFSKLATRRAKSSTKASSSASGIERFTQPYFSAVSASKSLAPQMISKARERPARAHSHSVAPPPGTTAAPTSAWASTAFSLDAKRMSQASASSEPWARARPRNLATLTTCDCASLVTNFGHALNWAAPGLVGYHLTALQVVVRDEIIRVRALEDNHLQLRIQSRSYP